MNYISLLSKTWGMVFFVDLNKLFQSDMLAYKTQYSTLNYFSRLIQFHRSHSLILNQNLILLLVSVLTNKIQLISILSHLIYFNHRFQLLSITDSGIILILEFVIYLVNWFCSSYWQKITWKYSMSLTLLWFIIVVKRVLYFLAFRWVSNIYYFKK